MRAINTSDGLRAYRALQEKSGGRSEGTDSDDSARASPELSQRLFARIELARAGFAVFVFAARLAIDLENIGDGHTGSAAADSLVFTPQPALYGQSVVWVVGALDLFCFAGHYSPRRFLESDQYSGN